MTPQAAAISKKIAAALAFAASHFAGPLSAEEPQYLGVGDEISVTIGCTAAGHAVMTSADVIASRAATSEALALLRADNQCMGIPGRTVEVLKISAPVFVERLGKNLFGLRFQLSGRDLWAAHYEVVFRER